MRSTSSTDGPVAVANAPKSVKLEIGRQAGPHPAGRRHRHRPGQALGAAQRPRRAGDQPRLQYAGAPGLSGDRAAHRALAQARREHHHQRGPDGRSGARHRLGGGLGRPRSGARRAGAGHRARPLPVHLLGTAHLARHADALSQRADQGLAGEAHQRSRAAHPRIHRARSAPGRVRTARSGCGAPAATTCSSTPMSPTSSPAPASVATRCRNSPSLWRSTG